MAANTLRDKLIDRIRQLEDEEVLGSIERLLDLTQEDQVVYQLSDAEQTAIQEGREDIEAGRFLTNDQANQEIDEWLGKQSGPPGP